MAGPLLRIWTLVVKEFIQFRRDWIMSIMVLTFPVAQLVLLAQATGRDIANLRTAVLDLDRSSTSRALVQALENQQRLEVCCYPRSQAELRTMLDEGQTVLAVVVPDGFAGDLLDPREQAQLQLIADGSNTVVGSLALGAANEAVNTLLQQTLAERGTLPSPPVDLRLSVFFNPDLNTRDFTIPAQVGFIVYQVTLAIASMGLARERELGTLAQLLVMPLRRFELITGKAVVALVIGFVNFLMMLGSAVYFLGVPMRGSLLLLSVATLLFIFAEIGYGLLLSGLARTQQQAILLVFVLAMMDMTFSGYLVRIGNLPLPLQIVAQVVPFSHYLTVLRAIMLKGAGLDALWPHMAAILAIGALITAVAMRSIQRALD